MIRALEFPASLKAGASKAFLKRFPSRRLCRAGMIDGPGYLLLNLLLGLSSDKAKLHTTAALSAPRLTLRANVAIWVAHQVLGPLPVIEIDRKPPVIGGFARLCCDRTHSRALDEWGHAARYVKAGLAATMAPRNTAPDTQTLTSPR